VKENNYFIACTKLRRVMESCADRVVYLDGKEDEDFDNNRSLIFFPLSDQIGLNFNQHILENGIEIFSEVLRKKTGFYNGYNLTLVWKKIPVVEMIDDRLFLIALFYFYDFDEFDK